MNSLNQSTFQRGVRFTDWESDLSDCMDLCVLKFASLGLEQDICAQLRNCGLASSGRPSRRQESTFTVAWANIQLRVLADFSQQRYKLDIFAVNWDYITFDLYWQKSQLAKYWCFRLRCFHSRTGINKTQTVFRLGSFLLCARWRSTRVSSCFSSHIVWFSWETLEPSRSARDTKLTEDSWFKVSQIVFSIQWIRQSNLI